MGPTAACTPAQECAGYFTPKYSSRLSHGRGIGHARHVLQTEYATVAHPFELADDEGIVDLAAEQFISAGHARAVDVADHVEVPLDVPYEIAGHDLHVVAVEQEPQTGRVEPAAQFGAAIAAGEPIAGVIVRRIERFQEQA